MPAISMQHVHVHIHEAGILGLRSRPQQHDSPTKAAADRPIPIIGLFPPQLLVKPQRLAKCQKIADFYHSIGATPRDARLADGPECKTLRDLLIHATGAEFRRVSPSGERIFLYHPISDEINFSCAAHGLTPDISLGWEKGAAPSKAWIALAVKAAQVT